MLNVESQYAEALIEIAAEHDLLDIYSNQLGLIVELYENEPDFRDFLTNPVIKIGLKKDLVSKAFGDIINSSLVNFMFLLIDKKRLDLLPSILTEFRRKADKIKKVLQIEIYSAHPLDDCQIDRIKNIYKKENAALSVHAELKLDPSLIGGVLIKIGDKIIDSSIKGRLEQLNASVMEA
jgi:F-type H+-transporting ATPase subunit delta